MTAPDELRAGRTAHTVRFASTHRHPALGFTWPAAGDLTPTGSGAGGALPPRTFNGYGSAWSPGLRPLEWCIDGRSVISF
jgi:hypothetical protein